MGNTAESTVRFKFDNTYFRDLENAYVPWQAEKVASPHLLKINSSLAEQLGLDADHFDPLEAADVFSGQQIPQGANPLAQAYAGHQFGGFSPQLGDGRALLLGEVLDLSGERFDIQLKGSGRTPFSRGGDGKASLAPMLREYIMGEAMHALKIPTTRGLAVTLTGETVRREKLLPGAVLTRVASSHLRVGTFQFFSEQGDTETLSKLMDYTIQRHYPQLQASANKSLALLDAVCERQASLIAQWMQVGFIHGVMNTDNMALSGETIDYGPCAFMNTYNLKTVFSSIDRQGRYSYGRQPSMAQWNLARFAETLIPWIDEKQERAIELATESLQRFEKLYNEKWLRGMGAKLGLLFTMEGDSDLIKSVLDILEAQKIDFTLFFRKLSQVVVGNVNPVRDLFAEPQAFDVWCELWIARLRMEKNSPDATSEEMNKINPAYIPRNHKVEEALAAAVENKDMTLFESLLSVLADPFSERRGYESYMEPNPKGDIGYQTFCGT